MTRLTRLLAAAAIAASSPAYALTGTCTSGVGEIRIVAHIPTAGDFDFQATESRTFGVDIDPASGRFTLQRSTVAPLNVDTAGGPVDLHLEGSDAVGTIDASGNVNIPQFSYNKFFGPQPLPDAPTLTTGTNRMSGTDYAAHGAALDFTTGRLTLEGGGTLANAPLVGETVLAGLSLRCVLTPVPDESTLPKAAALKGVSGTTKTGKEDEGDTLKLHAVLVPGAVPLADPLTSDLLIGIRGADRTDEVVFLVAAGALHKKGRKFSVKDDQATTLVILRGRKGGASSPTPSEGTLSLTTGKRSVINLRVTGVDASTLTGALVVSVTAGPNVASANVTVKGRGKTHRLH
jgi:hypothetical protein